MSIELINQLKKHEGFSKTPYKCTAGKLTIGYGRNLEANGINEEEAELMLNIDVLKVKRDVNNAIPANTLKHLNGARKSVLYNMAFNLGISGLLGFKKMLAALAIGDFTEAAKQMLDSKWSTQVKGRSAELAEQMRTGEWQF